MSLTNSQNMNTNLNTTAKSEFNPFRDKASLALAALLLLPATAGLADSYWQGGTSDFNNPASWSLGVVPTAGPAASQNADNDSGSNNVVLIKAGDPVWNPWDIRAGDGANASGSYLQTGDTINVGGWFRLADSAGSAGYYTLSNGVLNCALQFHVGEYGTGVFEMDGGTLTVAQTPLCMGDGDFGPSPTGTLLMRGGTINTATGVELWLGEGHNNTIGGTGTMIMTGGAVNIGSWFAIGRFGGIGDLELSGGSITMSPGNPGNITVATVPSTGVVNQSGGAITNTVSQTWIAESAVGTWNLNGGVDMFGVVHLTQNGPATGTFNLNGGDLIASEVTDNGGNGSFYFNGGTLHASGASPNLMHNLNVGAYLSAGGAIIDSAGFDATISQSLADNGGGGLTKIGGGTLTLSGVNTYTGPTHVSAGTLAITTASVASGTYSVADGAAFSLAVTVADGQFNAASLTLGSTTGAALGFDLGSFGNPTTVPLNVTGNLAVNGTAVINVADSLPQLGQFPLLKYATMSGSGTFKLGTVPAGVFAALVNNSANNSIDLNITNVVWDIWNGLAGGTWDNHVTTNWTSLLTGLPAFYADGGAVIFDDTALGTTVVNLTTTVEPGSIAIQNSTLDYTIVGNGRINGSIGLNKQGAALFTMGITNGFTGPVVLSGGTLVVSNLANGGVASAIGASSASPTNLVLNGGALSYAGPNVTINRGYDLLYNYGSNALVLNDSLDLQGNLTVTGPATAASGTSFVKSGPGTLTYAGSVTNQLSGGNDPGYQIVAGTVVFDGSSGGQVNHSQSEFWVGDTPNSGAAIVLTNTTLTVDSWLALGRGNGNSGFVTTGNLYNSTLNCGNLSLGYWNGRPNLATQVLTLTNSTLIDNGAFNLSESAGSSGTINLNGKSILTDVGPFLLGLSSGATGTLVMANSSIITNTLWASVGANGVGTLVMKDNAFLAEGSDFNFGDYGAAGTIGNLIIQDNAQVILIGIGNGVYVGKTASSIGTVTQTGGTINSLTAGVFQLGQQAGSVGTWLQSGGTNYAGGWVSIGRGANSGDTTPTGLLVVSGGLFDQASAGNGLIVGEQGTGTLTITNQGVVISAADTTGIGVAIGWNQGIGTLNLDTGGTLVANYVQNGSGSSTFNFNGGVLRAGPSARLNFMGGLTAANVMAGATIDTAGNTVHIAQALLDGGMGGGLTKIGTGTLLLDGANTYSGTTTVSAGTLGGIGTLAGPFVVQSGGTLSIGPSVGILTVNNTVNLAAGSTTVMKLIKMAGVSASDQVLGVTSMTYGGTLVLTNLAGTLATNDSFRLFVAGSYHGAFANVVSETPGQIVTWDLSQLAVSGTVKVATVAPSQVTITSVVSGTNLTLSWPAGQTGANLQEQINPLTVGLSTNWVTVPGSSTTNQMTFPIVSTNGTVFFRLVY
jgi:autotransporter-associated beta strand protein